MAGLDDVLGTLNDATADFNSNWRFDSTAETPGWVAASDRARPWDYNNSDSPGPQTFTAGNGFQIGANPSAPGLNYNYDQLLFNQGFAGISSQDLGQIAQEQFGGDAKAALDYRYGEGSQYIQDKRFEPYGNSLFAKPADPTRLSMEFDAGRYPKWNLGGRQPSVLGGIASGDFPATTIAGLAFAGGTTLPGFAAGKITGNGAVGALTNLASGSLGGGSVGISSGDYTDSLNDWDQMQGPGGGAGSTLQNFSSQIPSWLSDADPGGFVNPATGQPGPGLPGGQDYFSADSLMQGFGSPGGDPNMGFDIGANLVNNPAAFGSPSLADRAMTFAADNPGKVFNGALSLGSGIYGMMQARRQRQLAEQLATKSDPWGDSGGRVEASGQLRSFMADPVTASKADPSYALRIQAAQRASAPYGQGSGKMAIAAADASTSWYNDRLAQLGGLAGVGVNPGGSAGVRMAGEAGANELASKSLASIGYGAGRNTIPTAMYDQLMMRMMDSMRTGG